MGLFDKEVQLEKAEFAQNEQAFTLHSGEYLGNIDGKFGPQPKAYVVAGEGRDKFTVFGVKAEQIGRMESNDLPARVKIGRDGDAKPFVKAE